jgi:hypothetical protein
VIEHKIYSTDSCMNSTPVPDGDNQGASDLL